VDWSLLLNSALICGLVLSIVLTTIATVSAVIAPDMWVGDYPPDIKEKSGPMSPRAARLRPYVAVLFFIPVLALPILGLYLLSSTGLRPFPAALVYSVTALLVFNVFDLLVLDWLLFCTIQPRRMVLPGTEGMAGYRDYRFHFIGFLKGLVLLGGRDYRGGRIVGSAGDPLQMRPSGRIRGGVGPLMGFHVDPRRTGRPFLPAAANAVRRA
jgi:hypothetical protein